MGVNCLKTFKMLLILRSNWPTKTKPSTVLGKLIEEHPYNVPAAERWPRLLSLINYAYTCRECVMTSHWPDTIVGAIVGVTL